MMDVTIPYDYPSGRRTIREQLAFVDQPGFADKEQLSNTDGKLHVLFLAADPYACGYYRAFLPARVLNQQFPYLSCYPSNVVSAPLVQWAHVIVWERTFNQTSAQYFSEIGKQVIQLVDIDDDIYHVPPHNPAHAAVTTEEVFRATDTIIRGAQHLFTPSHHLGSMLQERLGTPFTVLPNMLYRPDWTPRPNTSDVLRIGWTGSPTHSRDLEQALPALRAAKKKFGSRIQIVIFGWDGWLPNGTNAFDGLDIEYHAFVPTDQYAAKLASLSLDIGLAPLADDLFNRSKSPIKFAEYSALGVPTIASKVGPYADAIVNNVTGMFARHPAEFERKLITLILDPYRRAHIAQNAQQDAYRQFGSDVVGGQYAALLTHLAQRYEAESPAA